MIEPKRLEELIKQEATILFINGYGCVRKLTLKKTYTANHLYLWCGRYPYALYELFETEDRAQWYAKTHATRTERFEPPMWEDIKETYEFDWLNRNFDYYFVYVDKRNNKIIIIEEFDKQLFDEPATKENYEKACEMVRDLFGGKNVEK